MLGGDAGTIDAHAVANILAVQFIVGSLSAGAGFQSESDSGFLLIQDQQTAAAGLVSATAGTTGTNTGRWYLLAMGIKHT